MSTKKLVGRRAFVTGGSKGIGAAIVRGLIDEGAEVVFAAQDMPMANTLAEEIGAKAVKLDVTDLDAVQSVVTANGPFDILVNNAGMDQHAFFTKTTKDDWRYLLAVNLEAVFATTHAALPAMQPARLPVQKGGDAFAQRQRSQLAGVEVAGELSDHDLDEAITGAGMLGPAPGGYRKINHEARAGAGMRLP